EGAASSAPNIWDTTKRVPPSAIVDLRMFSHLENQTPSPWSSQNLHRTLRQRAHEGAAIRFRHNPIVQNNNDAVIAFGVDETADSLTQFQDCFRQRIFGEGVATARFDAFQFRFGQG